MRSLLALLALGLLGVGVSACGGSSSTNNAASNTPSAVAAVHPDTTSPAAPSPTPPKLHVEKPTRRELEKYDRDEDDHTNVADDNNPSPVGYVAASPADRQAITELVKRYYAVALSGDGARACSLMDKNLAIAVPLDYGKLGPTFLRRAKGTCHDVMSVYFAHERPALAAGVPHMEVVRVSVKGNQGLAFVRFGRLHERGINELREGASWTIAQPLDGELE